MKLNNKGMSVVEVVITFAIIMMITTGLLMIVVNYRSKVSVSSERLAMDTFKNNVTQDIYNDMLRYGVKEIHEFNYIDFANSHDFLINRALKKYVEGRTTYPSFMDEGDYKDETWAKVMDLLDDIFEKREIKDYANSTEEGDFLNVVRDEFVDYYGDCITLTDLNRCVNIQFQVPGVSNKAFGTSIVNTESRESIENKYLYYDGIKYKINDKLPDRIPKDASGNERKLVDLQRIKITDDGILGINSTVLEDSTIVKVFTLNVLVYHVDFREDFGIHIVVSNDDISM